LRFGYLGRIEKYCVFHFFIQIIIMMEEVTAEINVIKAILACPDKYPDKTSQERFEKLKERFPEHDCLFTYFRFTEQELKNQLDKLQDQLNELQKEKNLLQEEKLKLMTPTAGNHCFVL
jgi:predicted nuclease with TOPRIM domain